MFSAPIPTWSPRRRWRVAALCLWRTCLWRTCLWGTCLWGTSGIVACSPARTDAAGAAAQLGSSAPVAQLRQAISGGEIERNYSGTLALITVTRERVELCTVTLLAPNLAATARHCVAATPGDSVRCDQESATFDDPYDSDALWVNRGRALRNSLGSYGLLPVTGGGDELLPVADVFVPDTERVCGGDLALLLLGESLDEAEAQPIAPRLDDPVRPGEEYTAVGFGSTPDPDQQGTRRSREGLQVTCTPDDCVDRTGMESTEFRGEDGVCSGDSGGPAIDAAGRVTGIASRSVGCTGSVYSALGNWRGFVREVAELAAREGDYPEPEWLVEAPPQPDQEPAAPEGGNAAPSEVEPAPSSDDSISSGSPSDDTPAQSAPERGPVNGGPVASDGGGCSLQRPSSTPSWSALLLLGLALTRRYRGARSGRGRQRG